MHLSPTVFFIVLAAAALHAGLERARQDPARSLPGDDADLRACGHHRLAGLAITGLPRLAAWPWIILSVTIHLGYYLFLAEAYRRADMSQIYPIARGSAPLLTALCRSLFVHDPVTSGNMAGIVLLGIGVLLISLKGQRHPRAAEPRRHRLRGLTAVTISAYTLVDGVGARVAGDANAYAAALFSVDAYPMLHSALAEGPRGIRAGPRFPPAGHCRRRHVARRLLDRHLGDDGRPDRTRRRDSRDQRALRRIDRGRRPQRADDADSRHLGPCDRRRPRSDAAMVTGWSGLRLGADRGTEVGIGMAGVKDTTTPGHAAFVEPGDRIATFYQDGTLWVEHPAYSQLFYCFDRVPAVVNAEGGPAAGRRPAPHCSLRPSMPRGRRSSMMQRNRPIAASCRALARACISGGTAKEMAAPDKAQSAQTSTAPRIAPRLLPAPPMISMVHT